MKLVKYLLILATFCILLAVGLIYGLYKYLEPQLPDVSTLREVQLQQPMQVFSKDGELIAQYGEKRRIPLTLEQMPQRLIDAFIAVEDSRFYGHHGLDPVGIFRALSVALSSGRASQGASTITQQLARNFFLTPERSLKRKITEVFLAVRIERLLTKNEILELYLNKIYFGQRAYGVGAATQVYFGKTPSELTLGEMAMIAGLPKAPSTFNPVYSQKRATERRNLVLSRMLTHGYISHQEYEQARQQPVFARYHGPQVVFSAPYLTEMVRQEMLKRYGENAYTDGYKVYTTITAKLQQAADNAVRNNILDYDMRHGYRGASHALWQPTQTPWTKEKIIDALKKTPAYNVLHPAVVTRVNDQQATALMADGSGITLDLSVVRWARAYRSDTAQGSTPRKVSEVLKPGELIRVRNLDGVWWLSQLPEVNSALVSLDPGDGAILALTGGFDFEISKFNRATQALRQLGSNIKPFLYTAALEKGLTLASIMNDIPISRWDAGSGTDWQPKNSPAKYDGPIRLRQGLGESKNVVMVRIMRAMGVDYAAEYLQRFGFPAQNIVRTESLALGAASFTPLQVVRGYSVMANGGFLIDPYFISKIENQQGQTLFVASPKTACADCRLPLVYGDIPAEEKLENNNLENDLEDVAVSSQQTEQPEPQTRLQTVNTHNSVSGYAPHVISTPLAFLIKSALNSDIFGEPGWMGTGWRAARDLKRHDIGGKTGTTNNSKDAWFSGYGAGVVTTVWIGFDDHRRALGRSGLSGVITDQISGYEGGAKSAQPAWNAYMQVALDGVPLQPLSQPPGVVSVKIDKTSGLLAVNNENSMTEYFITGTQPTRHAVHETGTTIIDNGQSKELF